MINNNNIIYIVITFQSARDATHDMIFRAKMCSPRITMYVIIIICIFNYKYLPSYFISNSIIL